MELLIRTPYNYNSLRSVGRNMVYMERSVRVADTDVQQDSASFSDLSSTSQDSYYTNSDVPIKVYGPGICSTPFNPMSQRVHSSNDVNAAMNDKVAATPLGNSQAAAAAAAVSSASSNAVTSE